MSLFIPLLSIGFLFFSILNHFIIPLTFQIYYVKAPQSNHAGVQYAPANALKIAYAPAPQPQHSVAYATAPTNTKVSMFAGIS